MSEKNEKPEKIKFIWDEKQLKQLRKERELLATILKVKELLSEIDFWHRGPIIQQAILVLSDCLEEHK